MSNSLKNMNSVMIYPQVISNLYDFNSTIYWTGGWSAEWHTENQWQLYEFTVQLIKYWVVFNQNQLELKTVMMYCHLIEFTQPDIH